MSGYVNRISNGYDGYQQMAPGGAPASYPQGNAGYGAYPMGQQLPPPMPGHYWAEHVVMATTFGPLSDGSYGPICYPVVQYFQAPFQDPYYQPRMMAPGEPQETPIAQTAEKVSSSSESVLNASEVEEEESPELKDTDNQATQSVDGKDELDDHGQYGDSGAVLVDSPLSFLGTPLTDSALGLLSSLIEEESKATHDEALNLYRTHFRFSSPLPSRGGSIHRYEEISRQGFYGWKEAALHELPLEIIDNLETLVHLEDMRKGDTEDCCRFLIPCSAKSIKLYDFEIQKGVIEITLSPAGKPLHVFLRPLDGRDEEYLEKNLEDLQSDYHEAHFDSSFPSLDKGVIHKESKNNPKIGYPVCDSLYFKCLSKYGLEITIPKK